MTTRSAKYEARRVATPAYLLATLTLASACTDRNAAPKEAETARTLRGEVELTLGAADTAPEFEFSRISGVAVDGKGRIFVADFEAAEIRVFGPEGKLGYRIGRKGQGPGELEDPCCLAIRGEQLVVRDNGNTRYNVYAIGDTSATYLRMLRLAHTDVGRWAPVTFDTSGNVIDIGTSLDSVSRQHLDTRFHIDTTGTLLATHRIAAPPTDSVPVRTVSRSSPGGQLTFFLNQPYGPSVLNAHGPNGERARAINTRYSVAWYGSNGAVVRTIERQHDAPALSPGEATRAESSIVMDMRRTKLTRQEIPYGVPQRKQPLRRLYFDRDGRLWVELAVAEGAPRRADVYARDGALAFTAEWPAAVDLSADGAIRGTTAHGIMRDSLDVERVVRMRLK